MTRHNTIGTIGTIGTKTKKQIALSNRTTGRQNLPADSCFKPFNSNSNGCSILESRDVISYDPYVYNWVRLIVSNCCDTNFVMF